MAMGLVLQGVDVLGQNELKLAYKRLNLNIFSGAKAPGQPHRGRGMGGKAKGRGREERETKGEDMGGKELWTGRLRHDS
jgi:hypothetical protein